MLTPFAMVPAQLAPKEQGASVAGLLKPLVSFEPRRCACAWMVVRYSRLPRPVAGIGDMTSVRQRKGSRGKESQLPAEPHSQPTICCSDHQPESSSFLGEWTFIQPSTTRGGQERHLCITILLLLLSIIQPSLCSV